MKKPGREELRKILKESLDEAEWSWLEPHVARQSLIVVSQELDLLEVGGKVAIDDSKSVQEWIASSKLSKPTERQVDAWKAQPEKRFLTLIVQPYVLIQEKSH